MPRFPPLDGADDEWSPPSIYDNGDDVDESDCGRDAAIHAAADDADDPGAWRAAEGALAGALAAAAAAVARLDERLLALAPGRRDGALRRLALMEIVDLAWAEGERLRPERLALLDVERVGRGADDAETLGRAVFAVRRATAAPTPLATVEAVAARLGAGRVRHDRDGERGGATVEDVGEARLVGLTPHPAAERAVPWLAGLAAMEGAHPLTRAGFGFAAWRRGERWGGRGRLMEPALLASAVALPQASRGRDVGLTFLPLALRRAAPRLRLGGSARDRLAIWLGCVAGAAEAARRSLLDLDAWAERACAGTVDMRGRGTPAVIGLCLARPVVSAPLAAAALDLSATRARDLLAAFERRGLLRETTGQSRFRCWRVAL